jgi:outer membrane lipopolysaccharide assembly protein LptE/RlpB
MSVETTLKIIETNALAKTSELDDIWKSIEQDLMKQIKED